MITVTDLTKVYLQGKREVRALDGVTLTVPAGSIHGIIGHSGAGKSTLVRCLTLLDRPTSGTVEINGVDLTAAHADALRTPTAAHVCPGTNSSRSQATPRSRTRSRCRSSSARDVMVASVNAGMPFASRNESRSSTLMPARMILPNAVACVASWKPNSRGRMRCARAESATCAGRSRPSGSCPWTRSMPCSTTR